MMYDISGISIVISHINGPDVVIPLRPETVEIDQRLEGYDPWNTFVEPSGLPVPIKLSGYMLRETKPDISDPLIFGSSATAP